MIIARSSHRRRWQSFAYSSTAPSEPSGGEVHTVRARTPLDVAVCYVLTHFLSFTGGIRNHNYRLDDADQTSATTFQLVSGTGRTYYLPATARI